MPAEFDRHTDEELVALFLANRDRDPLRADAIWWELIARAIDRIRNTIGGFTWTPSGQTLRVAPGDCDDVVALAVERLFKARENFTGPNLPVFRAFTATTAKHVCMDFHRKEMNRDKHARGSMDEVFEEGDLVGPLDASLGHVAQIEFDRAGEAREEGWIVHEAIRRIENDSYREVVEMTLTGILDQEIAERLGIEINNVQARRSRGFKVLREKLKEVGGDALA